MKTWTITLNKKDIFYDIDAITHDYAMASREGVTARERDAMSSDAEEQADHDVLTRFADNRVSSLVHHMSFAVAATTDTTSDDTLSSGDYTITLSVLDRCEDKVLDSITKLMHEYVVKGSLKDWYDLLGVSRGDLYSARLAEIEKLIIGLLLSRSIPAVRTS